MTGCGTPGERTGDVDGDVERLARPVWGEIDLDAIAHNVNVVRQWIRPDTDLTVSVKANAYGHGVVQIVNALEAAGVHQVMTSCLADARAIRAAGSQARIVMLPASLPHEALAEYARIGVIPTIFSLSGAEQISRHVARPIEVFVKVDAGLGRVGVPVEDAAGLVSRIARLPNLRVSGVYTHLPFADEDGEAWARQRLAEFVVAAQSIRRSIGDVSYVQAVSSPGVLAGLDSGELTAVCVGSLIYGLPVAGTHAGDRSGLSPALSTIRARLIDVAMHHSSRSAGSGGRRRYRKGARIGLMPIGLHDGYRAPRRGHELYAFISGERAPVVGVTLAYSNLDLTALPRAAIGDEAFVLGSPTDGGMTLDELANAFGTTAIDVAMRFDRHIAYDYIFGGAPVATPTPNAARGPGY